MNGPRRRFSQSITDKRIAILENTYERALVNMHENAQNLVGKRFFLLVYRFEIVTISVLFDLL
jgi:hypothetical protein